MPQSFRRKIGLREHVIELRTTELDSSLNHLCPEGVSLSFLLGNGCLDS